MPVRGASEGVPLPTYEYQCKSCRRAFEAVQSFSDAALSTCEICGGTLKKVYGAVGIVFKGSGFYKTDSRASGSSAKRADDSTSKSNGNNAPVKSETTTRTSETGTTDSSSSSPAKQKDPAGTK